MDNDESYGGDMRCPLQCQVVVSDDHRRKCFPLPGTVEPCSRSVWARGLSLLRECRVERLRLISTCRDLGEMNGRA